MWRSIRLVGPIRSATETIRRRSLSKNKSPSTVGVGVYRARRVCLGKDPLKDFWNAKCFFLRDRAAFLVGVSKHGWTME